MSNQRDDHRTGPSDGGARVLSLGDTRPQIASDAYLAPGSIVVGDVRIGRRSSVWYGTVIRADNDAIVIGEDCNIQDGCVLHADPGQPVVIGDRVTVGHGAIVHAALIESDTLIGMGAIVLNRARVGSGALVAAGAIVRAGAEIPPGSMAAGVPAKVRRPVSDAERETIATTPAGYVTKAERHRDALEVPDPADGR